MKSSFKSKRTPFEIQQQRIKILWILACLLCTVLMSRLFYLQVMDYDRYRTLSFNNQMSVNAITPPRGIIVDRNGVVLADNLPMYVLEIIPEKTVSLERTLHQLQKLLPSITDEDIQQFYRFKKQTRNFLPTPLKIRLTQEEIARFAVNQFRFPGVLMKAESLRYYPKGEEMAHVLGYVGRISPDELKHLDPKFYRGSSYIGKSGIERFYENQLHGENGYEQIETDVAGRIIRTIRKVPPKSGAKLRLSLDARLQHAAYEALGDNYGAVVMMVPSTGEILALASQPSFDPNHFVGGIPPSEYRQLANAPERPLFNRAVRGLYPPASTLKPYIGLIGLNTGVVNPFTRIFDPGYYHLPNSSHVYRDWNKLGHGWVNITRAVAVSCDPYFYNLGHLIGIRAMHDHLIQFGFGQLTNVDLFEESQGIVPSAEWKRKVHHASWYPGDSVITAIGQGFMLVSPLQMAVAVSTMAERGHQYQPHLLLSQTYDDGAELKFKPKQTHHLKLRDESIWTLIHEAMHGVTTSPEGTGYRFGRNPPYPVAAKTGTAQVFGGREYARRLHSVLPKALRDHSLFIAFSPVEEPRVAIAVIVEHDVLASQVARHMLDTYYKLYPLGEAA